MSEQLFTEHGGVMSAKTLIRAGMTRAELSRLARNGKLARLRPGWYSHPAALKDVRRAVTAGGSLTCVSALRHHGLWTPTPIEIHVRRTEALRNLPTKGIRLCRPRGRYRPVTRAIDPVGLALLTAETCVTADDLVVLMDSALNKNLLTEADLVALFEATPARRLLSRIDRAGSGTETYVRLRLRRRGVKVRVQVSISAVGRVDLLIGNRLVVECDSRSHHDNPASYATDRRRDRRLRARGFHVVRLTYAEVMNPHLWAEVEADLMAMIRRGDHMFPRPRG